MKICDIFYSIQGEGTHTGRAATFIRFHGCNLNCDFCDEPLHKEQFEELGKEVILSKAKQYPTNFVVLTGGEPSLVDLNPLIALFRKSGLYVAVETNGFSFSNIKSANWITYSPKDWKNIKFSATYDELKIVVNSETNIREIEFILENSKSQIFIQPQSEMDQVSESNVSFCVNLIKSNPKLRLSLQTHKLIRIP